MYYLSKGLHSRFLAGLFSVACIFSSFGMGNMTQANSIAGAMELDFGSTLGYGNGAGPVGGSDYPGRPKKDSRVYGKDCALYECILFNWLSGGHRGPRRQTAQVFEAVFHEAFQFKAAAGGGAGFASAAVIQGISKGTFSNEAGLGSAPIIYAAAEEGDGIKQGMWGIFQVFADTIVGCTVTALCILASGVLDSGLTGVA